MKIICLLLSFLVLESFLSESFFVKIGEEMYKNNIKIENQENQENQNPHPSNSMISLHWKSDNDNKITLDTSTGLEWLDLTETKGLSPIVMEAGGYNQFTGWRKPTTEEILTFFSNGMPLTMAHASPQKANPSYTEATDPAAAFLEIEKMYNLLGITQTNFAAGLYRISNTTTYFAIQGTSGLIITPYNSATYSQFDNGHWGQGIWLVSEGGLTYSSLKDPNINIPKK